MAIITHHYTNTQSYLDQQLLQQFQQGKEVIRQYYTVIPGDNDTIFIEVREHVITINLPVFIVVHW